MIKDLPKMEFGEFVVKIAEEVPLFCQSLLINRGYLEMDPVAQCEFLVTNLHYDSFTLGDPGWIDDQEYLYMLYLNVKAMKRRINAIYEEQLW